MNDLTAFISQVSSASQLSIEENFGDGFVRLRTAEAERRQAKHDIRCVEDIVVEMLRNSRDAGASTIYLSTLREGDEKTLVFVDDGSGIPADMQERIFEPRVTSKLESMVMDRWGVHGRGMALYSIKSNTDEARVVASAPEQGSAILAKVDLQQLPEKKDQSTYPTLIKNEDGVIEAASGPHNVIRTCIEFALECYPHTTVYLGSPTDIVATLFANGREQLSDTQLLFCDDPTVLPVWQRPAAASDAGELVEIASSLGLPISERTAHRILNGQIEALRPVLARVMPSVVKAPPAAADIYKDSRGLKIAKEDLEAFSRAVEREFEALAQRYYLQLSDAPKIRVGKDSVTVKFPINKEL